MAILIALEPPEVSVEPGAEAICTVRIRNSGPLIDEFTAEVVGEVGGWAIFESDAVRLFPDEVGTVSLHIRPPRTHRLVPGAIPFGIRVTATSVGAASSVVEEGKVRITPFTEVAAAITPRRSRARITGQHKVEVSNSGNIPAPIRLTGSDPDDVLDVRFRRPEFELAPGQRRRVRTKVRPAIIGLQAGPEPHQFDVSVAAEGQPPIALQAAMVVRRVVPIWVPIVLAALVAAVILLIALIGKQNVQTLTTTGALGATPSPSPGAGATAAKGGGGAAAPKSGGGAAAGASGAGAGGSGAAAGNAAGTLSAVEAGCLTGSPAPQGSIYNANGNANDSGPNPQNGTLTGGTTYGPGQTGQTPDQAFSFPGGTSAVDLGPNVGQLGSSSFCVALAVKTAATSAQSLIGDRTASAGGTSWDIRMQPNGQPYAEMGSITVPGYAAVNNNAWHRICLIRSDTLINLYVDGTLVGSSDTSPISNVSSGGDTHLGWDGFVPYTGSIDNIVIVQG